MLKQIFGLMAILIFLSACATQEKEVSSAETNQKEEMKEEKLSPIDEIAKIFLTGDYEASRKILYDKKDVSPEIEWDILKSYLSIFRHVRSEGYVETKEHFIDSALDEISKNTSSVKLKEFKEKYTYFNDLLNEEILPLVELKNSGKIEIGMNETELIVSLGYPDDINITVTSDTVSEQWVYSYLDKYVYLEDGIVTSFQD